MPRQVDHEERRREIAGAVRRLAERRGLQGVTFREVAAEAGISVSLVQHYFGSKANLLATSLNVNAGEMGQRAILRLDELGADPGPVERIASIAGSFLPIDPQSRAGMQLFHAFAAAALTDESLRSAQAFEDEAKLRALFAAELSDAKERGLVAPEVDPSVEARTISSLVTGLSLAILLDTCTPDEALDVIGAHMTSITSHGRGGGPDRASGPTS